MAKTPDYTRKAIDKYNNKYYRLTLNIPKEYTSIIKEEAEKEHKSPSKYITDVIIEHLKSI